MVPEFLVIVVEYCTSSSRMWKLWMQCWGHMMNVSLGPCWGENGNITFKLSESKCMGVFHRDTELPWNINNINMFFQMCERLKNLNDRGRCSKTLVKFTDFSLFIVYEMLNNVFVCQSGSESLLNISFLLAADWWILSTVFWSNCDVLVYYHFTL